MTQGVYTGVNYQIKGIIDSLFAGYWFIFMSGDAAEGLDLWKRNFGVYELEVDGTLFYYSQSALLQEYRALRENPDYAVGVRCPCRFRDGFNPPVPICS